MDAPESRSEELGKAAALHIVTVNEPSGRVSGGLAGQTPAGRAGVWIQDKDRWMEFLKKAMLSQSG